MDNTLPPLLLLSFTSRKVVEENEERERETSLSEKGEKRNERERKWTIPVDIEKRRNRERWEKG